VLFTLVAQGLTTHPLLNRLGLTGETDGESDAQMSPRQQYANRREQIHSTLEELYQNKPEVAQAHTFEALRQLLHVEREAVRDLSAKGQISPALLDELIKEIDDELEDLERIASKIETANGNVTSAH
jgi:hypothetical protein